MIQREMLYALVPGPWTLITTRGDLEIQTYAFPLEAFD